MNLFVIIITIANTIEINIGIKAITEKMVLNINQPAAILNITLRKNKARPDKKRYIANLNFLSMIFLY